MFILFSYSSPEKGIEYFHRRLSGPISVHILEVDPNYLDIRIEKAQGQFLSLEKTSSISSRTQAIGAVNGGFFRSTHPYRGCPSGALKIDKIWLSSTRHTRGAIGWSQGGKLAMIDRIITNPSLTINNVCYALDCVNQPRPSNQAVLYNSEFHSSTLTSQKGLEIQINNKDIVINSSYTSDTSIPKNGMVYSIGLDYKGTYPIKSLGNKASFFMFTTPTFNPYLAKEWGKCDYILGGAPLLIYKNQRVLDYAPENCRDNFLTCKHARTAVGIRPNGHWIFVVIDEGQMSIGMTIDELSSYMESLGCEYALNLDGGSSSTMVLNNAVVNSPSGHAMDLSSQGKEVEISDAIIICSPKSVK